MTNVLPAPRRRSELTDFLRARRARLSPQDVGLAPGLRRRTAGLRREEVAQLAGVGVTWYTWLEQGRPINASVQVLDAVARTLRLDDVERAHLYRLADVPALAPDPEVSGVPAAVQEILDSLGQLPGMVINARYDVIANNRAHANLIRDWHSVPCEARNVLWCCFSDPEVSTRFPNFEDEAPHMVATLRGFSAQHLDEPGWTDFISRLSARSATFASLWERHDVATPGVRVKHFRHPVVGDLRFTSTSMAVLGTPEHRLVVYTPHDEQTRAKLPLPGPAGS
ncbi:helix-turn-helix transcriptional regulator [Rugosimonospora africana]|uniref:Transcriptional regulator n=1 Tax=Rugosimonospora africana TaxID=556532 RepID=A0A8J3VSW3_9ACTN|nr:helix-turn-helix transcriptional regulator [Rugosimonospora africana]GIH17036.1 transcriptional regulator [Rugosimonospora africana]